MGRQRNEGEGNRTADKQYVEATKRFIDAGKVQPAADRAKKAMDSPESLELKDAAEKGKQRGHGEH